MKFENIPEKYFDLLKTKKYSDLNEEEKNLVLQWINKEDYIAYHFLINESISTKGQEDLLIPEFESRKKSKFVYLRLPISSVAAIVGIAIFVSSLATFYLSERNDYSKSNLDAYPTLSIEEDDYPMNFIIEM